MERTIKEWLGSIPDEEIRARALANTDIEQLDAEDETFAAAIMSAFIWDNTKEGREFWAKFKNNVRDYNVYSTFLELQHLLPEGDHLASHINDAVTEPLNKEIEGLKERLARAVGYLSKWKPSHPADDLDFEVKSFIEETK